MAFIFLDESGDFFGDKEEVFVVGGFIINEPRRTSKGFRKWQKAKFNNKRLKYRNEVKFSDTRLSDELRLKTLVNLTNQDIRVFYSFLTIRNIPLEFRQKDKLESGRLYAEIVANALKLLLPTADLEFRVFLDQRHLKNISFFEFREILRLHLLPNLPAKALLQIEMVDSASNPNIQIADWICGALRRYFVQPTKGKDFFDAMHNNIIVSSELFKDYWFGVK